jgi:hypothetical protein
MYEAMYGHDKTQMEGMNDIYKCPSGRRGEISNVEGITTLIINKKYEQNMLISVDLIFSLLRKTNC